MYSRADLSLDDRLEIISRHWRFGEEQGTVTRLAEEFRTSRRFVYDLSERVKEALDWRRAGRRADDHSQAELAQLRQRVRELAADCEQLQGQLAVERERAQGQRFRLLLELALCPVSEDKIARCLEAAFGREGRVSAGWVNAQLQQAGAAALSLMQKAELRHVVREAALDELFRHRQPILCVIDPQTLLATVPQAAENRKGATWQAVLEQYPQLEFVVSDQASGLRKGVNECGREIAHQYDIFHFKREIKRWLRSQEARCYEWMERTEQARRLLVEPRLGAGARIQATVEYRQQAAALEERLLAFDWIEVIVAYLEESLAAYDVRRHKLRTSTDAAAILNEVVELLREIRVINTRPLITMIEGARPGLFTFLTVLEGKLQQVEVCWRHVTGCRRAAFNALACAWHARPRAHLSEQGQRAYLTALVGLEYWSRRIENFAAVQRQVYEALDAVVRASSAVECFNSLLRPYISVKKHLSQGFLALIALYHNSRPLKQRGNRTPFQLAGVDLGDDDWVRLIEHELRCGQPVVAQ
jgi:hypothetical protein